jgi:hypothetical protein
MQIKLDKDTITPELRRLMGEVKRPGVVMRAGAKAVQVALSKHMKRLQARGNKKGWPTRHFFAGGPTSVERRIGIAKVGDNTAEITIADARFVHRIEGGSVSAKRAAFLAIPLTAEAYSLGGKGTLRESMPGLKVIKFKRGLFLVKEEIEKRGAGSRGRGSSSIGRVRIILLFKLVKSVTHRKHPEEMPDQGALGTVAGQAMDKAARLLVRSKG